MDLYNALFSLASGTNNPYTNRNNSAECNNLNLELIKEINKAFDKTKEKKSFERYQNRTLKKKHNNYYAQPHLVIQKNYKEEGEKQELRELREREVREREVRELEIQQQAVAQLELDIQQAQELQNQLQTQLSLEKNEKNRLENIKKATHDEQQKMQKEIENAKKYIEENQEILEDLIIKQNHLKNLNSLNKMNQDWKKRIPELNGQDNIATFGPYLTKPKLSKRSQPPLNTYLSPPPPSNTHSLSKIPTTNTLRSKSLDSNSGPPSRSTDNSNDIIPRQNSLSLLSSHSLNQNSQNDNSDSESPLPSPDLNLNFNKLLPSRSTDNSNNIIPRQGSLSSHSNKNRTTNTTRFNTSLYTPDFAHSLTQNKKTRSSSKEQLQQPSHSNESKDYFDDSYDFNGFNGFKDYKQPLQQQTSSSGMLKKSTNSDHLMALPQQRQTSSSSTSPKSTNGDYLNDEFDEFEEDDEIEDNEDNEDNEVYEFDEFEDDESKSDFQLQKPPSLPKTLKSPTSQQLNKTSAVDSILQSSS